MTTLAEVLACPDCRTPVLHDGESYLCTRCGRSFEPDDRGYVRLEPDPRNEALDGVVTRDNHADRQVLSGGERVEAYLRDHIRPTDELVLDVGCGVGAITSAAESPGRSVFGVDVPSTSSRWAATRQRVDRFVSGDAERLPFLDDTFDLVWSLGVLEHIGETEPRAERWATRQRYVSELVRVTRPGGRVLLACPNKAFPLDPAHRWTSGRLRNKIWAATHLYPHRTWGSHPLPSRREVGRLLSGAGVAHVHDLSLEGYFAFGRIGSSRAGWIVPAARLAVERMPRWLRSTPLNPFVMVEAHVPGRRRPDRHAGRVAARTRGATLAEIRER